MIYLKYLKYLIRHKWFVFLECYKRRLIWRGIIHDLSKFLPSEFGPYAVSFYGPQGRTERVRKEFDVAWLLHQKRNRHHWQWWLLPMDEEGLKILPIQEPYLTEMFCDWLGAGRTRGNLDPQKWYLKNREKMQLHLDTRKEVEKRLGLQEGS